jgi:hypothetical protein
MDAARQRLQEQHDEKATLYAEKLKEVCNDSCVYETFLFMNIFISVFHMLYTAFEYFRRLTYQQPYLQLSS